MKLPARLSPLTGRRTRPHRRRARPWMERLEDRTTPAVLHVGPGQTHETINGAITAAGVDDTLLIHDGTYPGGIVVNKPLTLRAVNTGGAILDGGGFEPDAAVVHVAARSTFIGLRVRNALHGFYQRDTGAAGRIEHCVITDCTSGAIAINNGGGTGGSFDVVNVTIDNCASAVGINDGGTISITNSIIANANHAYVAHNNISINPRYNLLFNVTTVAATTSSGRINADPAQLIGDPLFANRGSGNYRLTVGSPAIDSGINVGLAFHGAAPDRGAFETVSNQRPAAAADGYTVRAGRTLTVAAAGVLANDTDGDGDALTAVIAVGPTRGQLTLNANGSFIYVPAAGFDGTDSFTYRANDGRAVSDPVTVTLTVTPNAPPVAVADAATINEDGAVAIDVLANDTAAPDTDETLTLGDPSAPAHGVVTRAGGGFRYTPAPNYHGPDQFTYTITDGHGGTATATVYITVTPVNDAPAAAGDVLVVAEDRAATIRVAANDFDIDGDTLTVTAVTQGRFGTVTIVGGQVSYRPRANFNGTDAFTYTVSDGRGGTATAVVTAVVTPVNDAPVNRAPEAAGVARNGTLTFTRANLIRVADVDAGTGRLRVTLTARRGTLRVRSTRGLLVSGDRTARLVLTGRAAYLNRALAGLTFRPVRNHVGLARVTVSTTDLGNTGAGGPKADTDTIFVVVYRPARKAAPPYTLPAYRAAAGTPLAVPAARGVFAGQPTPAGSRLTARLVKGPSSGTLHLLPDGAFRYAPARGFRGRVTFLAEALGGPVGGDPFAVAIDVL